MIPLIWGEKLVLKDCSLYEYIPFFGLVWFYGTSTIVGYLMPNPVFAYIFVLVDSPMTRIMDLPKENINQEQSWESSRS